MATKDSAVCPRKLGARQETIINPYRELYGESLPEDKQYWTLAAQCYPDDNKDKLSNGSEFSQMVESGLITPSQFHGINNSKEIVANNSKLIPDAHFYLGDFKNSLSYLSLREDFNPAIIYADYTKMAKIAVMNTSDILYYVTRSKVKDVMLVMNFPWNNPYAGKWKGDIDTGIIWDLFSKNNTFKSCGEHWDICKAFSYGGTGDRSKTTMVSIIFNK